MRFIRATAFCVTLTVCAVGTMAQQSRPSTGPQGKSGKTPVPGRAAAGSPRVRAVSSPMPAGEEEIDVEVRDQHLARDEKPLPPELEQLLKNWSTATAGIQRLQGEHLRRVYDLEFEIEKLSEGKFYWEAPDKGRIDVNPVEVTSQLVSARKSGKAKARKKKNGEPFDVETDKGEKWVCDGQKIYDIDVLKKECNVVQLPPNLQGAQIMDSPLPFLFGMPPEKARRRFQLEFSRPINKDEGFAYLTARPRTPQDAQNWSKAEIILDLKTFFPSGVQLTDPAGTKLTVYQFSKLERNKRDWMLLPGVGFNSKTIFQPDLRDIQVNVIGPDGRVEAATGGKVTVPNVIGMDHQDAVIQLERMGFTRKETPERPKSILLEKGPAARNADDAFTVESQEPKPGTEIEMKPGSRIKLTLWDKAK
ncbi:MAG: PASTA domain-containing protein [Planctomyces sp.]